MRGTSLNGPGTGRESDWLHRALRPRVWLYVAIAISIALVLYGIQDKAWYHQQLDLRVYLMGARHFFDGRIYVVRSVEYPHLPFTYTPFAGLFFYPLSQLAFTGAQLIWLVVSVGALVGVVALSLWNVRPDLDRRELWSLTAVLCGPAFWLEPVEANFHFGQINILLVLMVLADCTLALRIGRWRLPNGVLIGLSAAIKLVPLIFVAYFAAIKRRRDAVVGALTFLVVTAVAALCAPGVSYDYWTKYAFDASRVGDVYYLSNQSLRGSLDRLTHTVIPSGVSYVLAGVVAVAGIWLAARAVRESSVLLGVIVTAVTGMLVSPITWTHHLVWIIPMIAWMVLADDRPRYGCWWAALCAVVIWASPMWFVSDVPRDELRENLLESLTANAYFFLLVGFLVGVAFMLAKRARSATSLASS